MLEQLRASLFFRGWNLVIDAQFPAARESWERAFELRGKLPYDGVAACLDATGEFLRIAGDSPDRDRLVVWGAGADAAVVDDGRLAWRGQPGYGFSHASVEERAAAEGGFWPFHHVRWMPLTEPAVGHEEEFASFSCSPHAMHTRVWVPSDEETIGTPAGEFEDSLLIRATITRAPEDVESDSREAALNKIWSGEWYWWFARGVGPVAFRHEAENGTIEHALLSRFECPEEREE